MNASKPVGRKQLWMIRLGLINGAVIFAGVSLWTRSQRTALDIITDPQGSMGPTDTIRYVLYALAVAAVVVAVFLRPRVEKAPPATAASLLTVGWAVGEGAALFGIVQHFTTGSQNAMAIGMLAFVAVLAILPIPRQTT